MCVAGAARTLSTSQPEASEVEARVMLQLPIRNPDSGADFFQDIISGIFKNDRRSLEISSRDCQAV